MKLRQVFKTIMEKNMARNNVQWSKQADTLLDVISHDGVWKAFVEREQQKAENLYASKILKEREAKEPSSKVRAT